MADAEPLNAGREALLAAQQRAEVQFVVIGGAAIASHGIAYRTDDIHVTPERSQSNLQRPADVLNDLQCDIPFAPAVSPAATSRCKAAARTLPVAETTIRASVASLEDVEHSKRSAGRAKDLAYLQTVGRRAQGPSQQGEARSARDASFPSASGPAPAPSSPPRPPPRYCLPPRDDLAR
ncbi:MAG: hypothetical protein M3Z27_04115 [Actinomycetota bacterium]|nr:hypothetical protein [Actinomycetota bacterium]